MHLRASDAPTHSLPGPHTNFLLLMGLTLHTQLSGSYLGRGRGGAGRREEALSQLTFSKHLHSYLRDDLLPTPLHSGVFTGGEGNQKAHSSMNYHLWVCESQWDLGS